MTAPLDVIVIGAGGIGRRHLQALGRLADGDRILAVDPSGDAREAVRRDHEAARAAPTLDVAADLASMGGWPRRRPLVIVATGADVRAAVTLEALEVLAPGWMVLEKVLFQRVADHAAVARALDGAGVPTWVNHPRAYGPAWQRVGALLEGVDGWDATVSGRGWGLACNGLHLVERLIPRGVTPHVDTTGLDRGSVAARRPGVREVTGTLVVGSGAHAVTLRDRGGPPVPPDVHVEWETGRLLLQERGDHAVLLEAHEANGWQLEGTRFTVPLQSRLTDRVATELRATGTCALPTYADVAPQHEAVVAALLDHLRDTDGTDWGDRCPIT